MRRSVRIRHPSTARREEEVERDRAVGGPGLVSMIVLPCGRALFGSEVCRGRGNRASAEEEVALPLGPGGVAIQGNEPLQLIEQTLRPVLLLQGPGPLVHTRREG